MTSGTFPRLTLVLGGARSGKSAYAEKLASELAGTWTYIATAEVLDQEMRDRVAHHRRRRAADWQTLEVPLDLASALTGATAGCPVLVDCLTLWLSNVMLGDLDMLEARRALIDALKSRSQPTILVSNEVGLGIVPDNALARAFRDEAGRLNQDVAAVADHVVFVAAGLPLNLKGSFP